MNRTPKALDNEANEARAAAWLVKLEADTSAQTMASWQRWLRESARHHAAFARLESSWRQMDGLRSVRPLDGKVDPDLLDRFPGEQKFEEECASRAERPTPFYGSIAVALAAGLVSSLLVLAGWRFITRPDRAVHQTELGGFERVLLPDGSAVSLNTNSEIRIQFTHARRTVLLTQGEALFAVARDDLRPFEVAAGDNTVRAVGTAFDVRLRANGEVEVIVTQGKVALKPHSPGTRTLLSAGDDTLIDPTGTARTRRINPSDVQHRLAWTHGQIWFSHSTLAEAIAEFNRYNSRQFALADPALATLDIGGSFAVNDPDAFMAALEQVFGIRAAPADATAPDGLGTEVIWLAAPR